MEKQVSDLPLAVDMDGTLILTDMSWVSIKRVLLRRPWIIPGMLVKELSGRRAQWKRDLAERLVFDPSELEYHREFLDWLTGQQAKGRTLVLATASDRIIAEQVAGHVGLFSDVMASDSSFNLRGERRRGRHSLPGSVRRLSLTLETVSTISQCGSMLER